MSNYPNKLVSCKFPTPANPVATDSSGHTPGLTTAAIFVMEWDRFHCLTSALMEHLLSAFHIKTLKPTAFKSCLWLNFHYH